jgi:hypothetical protein
VFGASVTGEAGTCTSVFLEPLSWMTGSGIAEVSSVPPPLPANRKRQCFPTQKFQGSNQTHFGFFDVCFALGRRRCDGGV